MAPSDALPEIVCFGASMCEWSFRQKTQGFGWFLKDKYAGKAKILNEGKAGYTTASIQRDFSRVIDRAQAPGAAPTLLFTIFIGANDAAVINGREVVPYATFRANIRGFIDTILSHILTDDGLANTKIVLMTPPPIAIPTPETEEAMDEAQVEETNRSKKEWPGYKSYMSKKRYADGIMEIAKEYEGTGRVVGLNFCRDIVDAMLKDEGCDYDEEKPPGCGLLGAKEFPKGWFTDGLHLDLKGYAVLNKGLFELLMEKWPELAPENL